MQRAASPASLRSQDAAGLTRPAAASGPKAGYRLFPSVDPTPPATPVSLQTVPPMRRSSSLDDCARTSIVNQYASRLSQLAHRWPRKASVSEIKPMSTLQELPVDSPTVPTRYTPTTAAPPVSEDGGHGRSSSAPTGCVRDNWVCTEATQALAWMNKQAATSTQSLHGLGLTFSRAEEARRPTSRQAPKRRPDLRIMTGGEEDGTPPPPPPKSPRQHSRESSTHSETNSAHSRVSSTDGPPIVVAQTVACTAVKPTFVNHRTSSSGSIRRASTASESQQSDHVHDTDTQAGNVVGAPETEPLRVKKMLLRKPVPQPPGNVDTEKADPPLPFPSSKFSTGPSISDLSTEGETTPRALPLQPDSTTSVYSEAQKGHSNNLWLPVNSEPEDKPPPTPRKNSITPKVLLDERGAALKSNILGVSAPPPTPRKDSFRIKKGAGEQGAAAPLDNDAGEFTNPRPPPPPPTSRKSHRKASLIVTTRLELPSRQPPPRPSSPQPMSAKTVLPPPTPAPSTRAPMPEPLLRPPLDRPTPTLHFRTSTPDLSSKCHSTMPPDPLKTLSDLALQTEALHTRYACLRSDRQKLSTSIVTALREQKAGPDYCNVLLDQHLCLAAINSSMDICFAKMKSLECRKEEAMAAVLRVERARKGGAMWHARSASSLRSDGRSTPDEACRGLPNIASKLRKNSAREDEAAALVAHARDSSTGSESAAAAAAATTKRNTMILSPLEDLPVEKQADDDEEELVEPVASNRLRIKGAKAAKILGLIQDADDTSSTLGSPTGITLPDDMPQQHSRTASRATTACSPAVCAGGVPMLEVYIPPMSPLHYIFPPTAALPAPPAPAKDDVVGPRYHAHARNESTCGSASAPPSSSGESLSSPEEDVDVATPKEGSTLEAAPEKDICGEPGVLAREVQVIGDGDDEILDYYHSVMN